MPQWKYIYVHNIIEVSESAEGCQGRVRFQNRRWIARIVYGSVFLTASYLRPQWYSKIEIMRLNFLRTAVPSILATQWKHILQLLLYPHCLYSLDAEKRIKIFLSYSIMSVFIFSHYLFFLFILLLVLLSLSSSLSPFP